MNARRRVKRLKELLAQIGLEPERVDMFQLSSAMAGAFVEAAEEMVMRLERLGPNPLKDEAPERVAEDPKVEGD